MNKDKPLIGLDGSSYMWRALLAGKDEENGYEVEFEGKPKLVNTAQYGYDICLGMIVKVLEEYQNVPSNLIIVFEGLNSKSKRVLMNSGYKAGADRPPEAYEEFNKLKGMLEQTFLDLGAQIMIQDYAEGDDTLAWLAQNTERDLIIATYDNDLSALNQVNAYGAKVETYIDGMKGYNKYGIFDFHLITTYKALVGDTSDKIKGCPGFGPAKFEQFLAQYDNDGLQELHDMLMKSDLSPLHDLIDDKDHKLIKMIYEKRVETMNSFDLARLRPEWVDTMQVPLVHKAGMVRQLRKDDDLQLKKWYGRTRLITADNFGEASEWILSKIREGSEVALDIETSTPPESDEWLIEQGKREGAGVDVFGSYLVGMGLTFGDNNQYSVYISVKHADTNNVPSETVRQMIAAIPREVEIVIQNVSFELCVLFNEWGERQMDNGYHGFLPNVLDTKFEASYIDENMGLGLKERSLHHLGYQQQTYDEVTKITAMPELLPPGGRLVSETYEMDTVGTGKFQMVEVFDEHGFPLAPVKGDEITKQVVRTVKGFDDDGQEVDVPVIATQTRQYKMDELSAEHVLGYGADDTITTAALHNFYRLRMQLEHTYEVYKQVEIDAAYQHAKNFIDGCDISVEKLNELAAHDTVTYDNAWATVRQYLIDNGWEGTNPPVYDKDIKPADIKVAYTIVTGEVLDTAMRTISKIITFIREVKEKPQFAELLERLVAGEPEDFNKYVQSFYKCEPQFNDGSPKQMQALMYDVMGLTIKVRNKPTDIMRANGQQGSPKTDSLAIAYALRECADAIKLWDDWQAGKQALNPAAKEEQTVTIGGVKYVVRMMEDAYRNPEPVLVAWSMDHKAPTLAEIEQQATEAKRKFEVLEALKLMAMVGTRRSLYYSKYPYFKHWKDGKIRSQHNQAATNTRRASESGPNKQQMPKHAKIEGQDARFREVLVPHHPGAVIVSLDFAAQELRVIADYSRDPNMLDCFIGENKKDMHALTGAGIAQRLHPQTDWSYQVLMEALDGQHGKEAKKIAKDARTLGKKTNFTTEYGAMAPKLAQTLMVEEAEAQAFIDAKESAFPVALKWKAEVVEEAKLKGFVRTMLGAVRHLRAALTGGDRWESSKAERQAVNFKIQGSSAEMTKLAEGRMWKAGLAYKYDAVCIGPIHDEVVWSVTITDLLAFLPEMHACMVAPYSTMTVPIESSISFGVDFYNQIEIGDKPTAEAITNGLIEIAYKLIAKEFSVDYKQITYVDLVQGGIKLQVTGEEKTLALFGEKLNADTWELLEAEERMVGDLIQVDIHAKMPKSFLAQVNRYISV